MKLNQLKTGVMLTYISMGIGTIISILYTPFMLRMLGKSEYGLYTLVSSVVAYLGLLNFGFGSSYMRYFAVEKAKKDTLAVARLNGMFMTVFSVLGLVALVAGIILTGFTDVIFASGLTDAEIQKTKILMLLLVINIAVSFPFNVFTAYINANEKYIFLKAVGIIKSVLNPFLMLPILLFGFKSVGLVTVSVFLNLFSEVLYWIYCRRKLKMKFDFHGFKFSMLKDLWIFSSFIFINMITDQINWGVDKFVLGIVKGAGTVAIYGVASQLNNYYLQFSSAISSVFIPRIHSLIQNNSSDEELTNLFTRIGRIQFIILSLILSMLIFFGRQFIIFWAGADYESAFIPALLLIIPVTIPSIQNIGIEIQRAKNRHKFRSIVYFAIAIGNILLSIPLSIRFGAAGAAFGTAVALFMGNGVCMNLYYHKALGINMVYFWGQISKFIPSLLIPIGLGIIINLFAPLTNLVAFGLCMLLYVIVFCCSMWMFGMNEQEKNHVPVHWIKKKLK